MAEQVFMQGEITHYTKFERARILGARALQISVGAPFLIKLTDDDLKAIKYDPITIAKLEFEKGVVPITVKRPMPVAKRRVKVSAPA